MLTLPTCWPCPAALGHGASRQAQHGPVLQAQNNDFCNPQTAAPIPPLWADFLLLLYLQQQEILPQDSPVPAFLRWHNSMSGTAQLQC